jgi:hypothetical protein
VEVAVEAGLGVFATASTVKVLAIVTRFMYRSRNDRLISMETRSGASSAATAM